MLVLDTELTNFTIGAIIKDIGIGLKHFTKCNKMAIVSHSSAINKFTDLFSLVAPGKAKGFTQDQIGKAIIWVSN